MNDDKPTNPDVIKHLEFIQSAMSRMASNSFQIKGWSITIFSALLALFASRGGKEVVYLFVIIPPTTLFWCLDTYYLQQERKFRGVYNDVAKITSIDNRKDVQLFAMPLKEYTGCNYSFKNVMWSQTIWPLYLLMILMAMFGGIIVITSQCK